MQIASRFRDHGRYEPIESTGIGRRVIARVIPAPGERGWRDRASGREGRSRIEPSASTRGGWPRFGRRPNLASERLRGRVVRVVRRWRTNNEQPVRPRSRGNAGRIYLSNSSWKPSHGPATRSNRGRHATSALDGPNERRTNFRARRTYAIPPRVRSLSRIGLSIVRFARDAKMENFLLGKER